MAIMAPFQTVSLSTGFQSTANPLASSANINVIGSSPTYQVGPRYDEGPDQMQMVWNPNNSGVLTLNPENGHGDPIFNFNLSQMAPNQVYIDRNSNSLVMSYRDQNNLVLLGETGDLHYRGLDRNGQFVEKTDVRQAMDQQQQIIMGDGTGNNFLVDPNGGTVTAYNNPNSQITLADNKMVVSGLNQPQQLPAVGMVSGNGGYVPYCPPCCPPVCQPQQPPVSGDMTNLWNYFMTLLRTLG